MSVKKFSIITSVIVGLMVVMVIVLSCIKVNVGIALVPDKINVYNHTSSAVVSTEELTPTRYQKLLKLYNSMTNLSIADYMFRGKSVQEMPSQDVDNKYSTFSESSKQEEVCIELIFNEKQSLIVSIDGNTKRVEFYALIMTVKKSTLSREVAVYFSGSTGETKYYSNSPILINAKQNALYKYASTI